jgi:UPF0176 protein
MSSTHEIIIFYLYTHIADPAGCVAWHKKICTDLGLRGRFLIAHEGINGTAEGTPTMIKRYEEIMHAQDGHPGTWGDFSRAWFKHSPGTGDAFHSLKVKARKEIVSLDLGEDDIDPTVTTGTHITPEILKQWIDTGEDVTIVDMRNDYEYAVGHFRHSIHPGMENFRELPQLLPTVAHLKNKKVLAVCTYGVRCEKASGYLVQQGFTDVYQLEGGIGTYMKRYPGEDFLGSLYVFDGRMLEQDADEYEVVGTCHVCQSKSEHFINCAYAECHKKMIACEACVERLHDIWCNPQCSQRVALDKRVAV